MNKVQSNDRILSSKDEMKLVGKVILSYLRLPFSPDSIPGSIMEHVLGHVRDAEVLNTYDFVDVIDQNHNIGWQVKSRKATTPVTWKRAKISNRESLILESESSSEGLDNLGAAIMGVCNDHLTDSISKYDLNRVGYIDLVLHSDKIEYIECEIPKKNLKELFKPSDFKWNWSEERKRGKKDQLPALHGFHVDTGERWWSWHGRGENQLHFVGEKHWLSSMEVQKREFALPSESDRISIESLLELLDEI